MISAPNRIFRIFAWGLVALAGLFGPHLPIGSAADWPPLNEVASKLRAESAEVPEPTPGQTNVQAYLDSLAPRVLMAPLTQEAGPLLLKARVYDHGAGVAYLRVGSVKAGLRSSLEKALEDLARTNTVVGTVLDLRYSEGTDYEAAADAAGLFASTNRSEFRLGDRVYSLGAAPGGKALPVMVLINRKTRGAAEALAAAVRATAGVCLTIGTNTAGQAREYRPLRLGREIEVQIAGAVLQLPGGQPMPLGGMEPDLGVFVSPVDESAYWTNEFQRVLEGRPAGRSLTFRLNEAELVRRRQSRESQDEMGFSGRGGRGSGSRRPNRLRPEPEPVPDSAPVVQDPALARALDLLSGAATMPTEPDSPAGGDSR